MTQDLQPKMIAPRSSDPFPALKRSDVDACAFPSWFHKFRRITPKATIIPLDSGFVEYLHADGVFLPKSSDSDDDEEDDDFDPDAAKQDDVNDEHSDTLKRPTYDFSELDKRIQEVIDEYEAVFPKLDWSSPQDAAWMGVGETLRCMSPEDVYLHLKSSDFVTHDLDHAYDDCEDDDGGEAAAPPTAPQTFHLILKKWFSMPKSHEFRCFVRQGKLIAISQRDINYYDFLQDLTRQAHFAETIGIFFDDKIKENFQLANYTFDVYLTRDESKVFLIDFNPYATRTDSLLFSWDEVHSLNTVDDRPVLRVVRSQAQASQTMPSYSHNRYPKDVVGLSDGSSIAEFAQKWRDALNEAVAETPASTGAHAEESPNR